MNVGELRELIKPLTDECEIVAVSYRRMAHPIETGRVGFADGEGYLCLAFSQRAFQIKPHLGPSSDLGGPRP